MVKLVVAPLEIAAEAVPVIPCGSSSTVDAAIEIVTKLSSEDRRRTQPFSLPLSRRGNCAFLHCDLSGVTKRFRQFGCAEHVCDAL